MLAVIIRFFLENKLVVWLLLIGFVGWGLATAPFNFNLDWLPRDPVAVDAIPDIGENQQIVFTDWPGQSPQDVQNQVTYPLTSALLGIPGVRSVRSTSLFGFSSIYLIFEEDVAFYWSRSRILEKLNSLPPELLPYNVVPALGPDATALGQVYWYTLEGRTPEGESAGGWDLDELRSTQDFYVRYGLSAAGGMSEVASIGGHVKEYQVDVDPEKMRVYGITLDQVMQAVRGSNLDVGAATLEINLAEYFVRGLGYLQNLEDLESSVVAEVNNVPIRLSDVARVNVGPAERGGTVLEVRSRVGDYLTAGAPLYTLTDLSQLWALFDAYERNLSEVRVGDRVRFAVASVPEQTFTARVSFIDPLIDPATRTATIRAEVGNSRGRLKPEMFIEGTIRGASSVVGSALGTNASTEEFSVPKTAVLWTGDRSVVYVEVPDADVPTYQFREVVLSAATGSVYGVVSGLEAGERVVTNGAFSIDAAAQLNNQTSMMNRDIIVQGREVEQVTALVIPDYSAEGSTDFRAQLWEVARAYLSLKDRMVASQPATPALLTPLQKAITAVDMSQVRDDAHRYWMQQFEAITTHLGGVAGATDLAEQRRQFGFLSQALINTLSAFGADETLYVQHCPMAFSGAGANWLSADPSIRNPYFGDAMLTCGSTTDTLRKPQ